MQFDKKQRKIYQIDEHMERGLKISETIANHRVVDTMLKMQENEEENSTWKFLQIFEYHHGIWCKPSIVV